MTRICEEIQPDLLDYSRGVLTGDHAREMKAHLDNCPECRAVLDEERAFALRLEALPADEPVNDVWALVRAQIRPRTIRPLAWLAGWRHASAGFRRAIAATALAATAAVTLYSFTVISEPPTNNAPTPPVVVKWSDDPLGSSSEAMFEFVDKM